MADVERPAQGRDLVVGQAGQHAVLEGLDLVAVPVEQAAALGGQLDGEAAAVGVVAVPFDQAAGFKRGDHVGHGLGGHEGVPGELGRGHVLVPVEHGQRRVLQGGQPDRAEHIVQPRSRGKLYLLDQVEEHRRCGPGHVLRVPGPAGPQGDRV